LLSTHSKFGAHAPGNPIMRSLYLLGTEWQLRAWKFRSYAVDNLRQGLRDTSITCPAPGPELYHRYLSFFVHAGLLEPPGS
jgi:hypothetical protein